MKTNWSIVEYPGLAGLARLEAEWRRLVSEMPDHSPQHRYETHAAYAGAKGLADEDVVVFALSDGNRVRALCPLERAVAPVLGVPTGVWSLSWSLLDFPRDLVCPPGEAERELLPRLLRHLSASPRRPVLLVMPGVLEGSAAWRCLEHVGARKMCRVPVGACDIIDCDRPFEELAAAFSKRSRESSRKAHERLAAHADVRFVRADAAPHLAEAFEAFVALEASGWKGRAGTALLQSPGRLALYRDLVARLGPEGGCEINALYAEGRCLASEFCLRSGSELASLKIAYDESLPRVTPGRLLVERTVERCCADPQVIRMNLVTSQPWHQSWRARPVPVHAVFLGLRGSRSSLLLAVLRLRVRWGPRLRSWRLRFKGGARFVQRRRGDQADGRAGEKP